MQITNHTDLLNYLATTFNLQSYLEIGVRKRQLNFDKIKCLYRIGVDPNVNHPQIYEGTSDEYFMGYGEREYDLIFIDGLHHADQVKRDFENSLKCLTERGFIVIHDTLPTHEKHTHVPRDSKIWFGDVYKFAVNLPYYEGIDCMTVDIDCGCTVVWKDPLAVRRYEKWKDISFDEFDRKRKGLLFVSDINVFQSMVKKLHDHIHCDTI